MELEYNKIIVNADGLIIEEAKYLDRDCVEISIISRVK